MLALTNYWKNILIDFIMGLLVMMDWKGDNYDLIFVIFDQIRKIIYYKPIKVTINSPGLVKIIIKVVVRYYGIPDSIIIDWRSIFTLKFLLLLCYFLSIKEKLFTIFYSQIDGQIKWQNSVIKAYLWAFVNFKQNN